jgi:hypothetical protein
MGRGDALGLDFQIPQNFIGQQQQAIQAPVAEEAVIQNPVKQGDYLAHVEGLSDKYYETAGILKAFAHDQAKKGVDVTQPDYSQPGGGELFKTFQKLSAVLTHTANDLANSNDIDKTYAKLEAEGKVTRNAGFNPRKQMSATMNPNQMYTSTDLNQATQNAATDLSQTYYTGRDAEAKNQSVRNPLIDFYQRRIQEDPDNAQYYQNQIAALPRATAQTAYQQLIPRGAGKGAGKVPPGVTVLKKIVNLSSGVWNDGTFKPITKDGKVYLENKEMTGESVGQYSTTDKNGMAVYKPKIIKRWLKDPETNVVTIEYQDPEVPADISSNQPGAIATNFISNNPKYGDVAKTMDIANSLGITDDTGSVIPETLTPVNADEIKAKGVDIASRFKKIVDSQMEKLKAIKPTGRFNPWNTSETIKLPNGKEIVVYKKSKDNYFIDNPEDVITEEYPNGVEELKDLSASEVTDWLMKAGLAESASTIDSTPQQTLTPRQAQALAAFQQKVGRQPSETELQKILLKFK